MSNKRAHNFYAGPAILPEEVLKEAAESLIEFQGIGMSIAEISHRSKFFMKVIEQAEQDIRDLYGLSDDYSVLFLQGGASQQFAMIPYNFLIKEKTGNYVVTGSWAKKAYKEAGIIGKTYVSASSEETSYDRIPSSFDISNDAAYLHVTSNNTIFGTQFKKFPETKSVPLIVDMSSDIFSRPLNINQFSMIYAGAQKNAGPAGVTLVILKKSMLEKMNSPLNTMWNYETHVKKESMFNTPPVFSIYIVSLVVKWLKDKGGLAEVEKFNEEKAKLIYDVIDKYPDFYQGHAKKESRSLMNITFRIPNEELNGKFIKEAEKENMYGLKGHREVGGLRASVYNALPMSSAKLLAEFMDQFYQNNN